MAAFHAHKQHSRGFSKLWLLLLLPVFMIFIAVAGSVIWYRNSLEPVSDSTEQIVVTVPVGSTAPEIGKNLESRDLIKSAYSFELYIRLNDYKDKLQAGGYKFTQSQSVEEIVKDLVNGNVATDLFTILPAQRLGQIKTSFIEAGFSLDEVNLALNPESYIGHPALKDKPADANLEGYLYPESFQMTENTTATQIVEASLDEMASVLTPAMQAKFTSEGLNLYQAVTLASIVEREVNKPEDRPIVAQVFLKRYNEGIMLGSDPTALYGALLVGLEPSVFADTPYNTRLYTGLPPGPINNVSEQSLLAVANPADTNYLFFVSGDDGKTHFSNTLEEHEAATSKYCIELCKSY